ncbi:MAG: LamG-like jellyroll fold domain-containing protein [Bacteroidota bacterium]
MKSNIYIKSLFFLLLCSCLASSLSAQNFGLRFDGTDDKLDIAANSAYDIGDNYTVEAWINATEWRPESWQGSILTNDKQNPDSGYAFRAGKNGTLSFVMSANNTWNEVVTAPFMNAKQWYHVAAVVQGNTMTLYINGEPIASSPKSGTNSPSGQNIAIGESAGFPGRVFNGILDEIRVWNVARTAQEIKDNQTTDFDGSEAGLVAYFPMNEGSGLMTGNKANASSSASFVNMDESAWVEGYSIPATDVGVVSISAPDEWTAYKRPVRVVANVQNFGSESISDIPMTIAVNGLPVIEETMDQTLEPGESAVYTFKGILDLSDRNANNVVVSTKHPDDANSLNDNFSYRYQRPDEDRFINISNNEQHNFGGAGQAKFIDVLLPEDMDQFEKILLHIEVSCPSGGCDPWDQPANISVIRGEEEFEIARFITPYRKACGPWTVDVTDFKTYLSGPVKFKNFIQVWGPSGWLLTTNLELIGGDNPLPFQKLTPLWTTNYQVYGDPAVSYDLPAQDIDRASNTEAAHMRMTITGHGQGNTDNAAEFSVRTHTVNLNGQVIADHRLWKSDCNQNPCDNQSGTWEFARAGWCPGEAVNPFILDLTADLAVGGTTTLDYVLEDYTNLLNTGYNDGNHTEPHYRIWSYLVEQSSTRFEDYNNLVSTSVTVQTNGDPSNPVFEKVSMLITNNGTETLTDPMVSYYVNEVLAVSEVATLSLAPGASMTYEFSEVKGFTAGDDNLVFAAVDHPNDENINDNISKTLVRDDLTSSLFEPVDVAIELWPNPTTDGRLNIRWDAAFKAHSLSLYDATGRLVEQMALNGNAVQLQLKHPGLYSVLLKDREGRGALKKIVVGQ